MADANADPAAPSIDPNASGTGHAAGHAAGHAGTQGPGDAGDPAVGTTGSGRTAESAKEDPAAAAARREAEDALLESVDDAVADFDIRPISDAAFDDETSVRDLRRARRRRQDDDTVTRMSLLEEDGILRWAVGGGPAPARRPRRRAATRGRTGPGPTRRDGRPRIELPPRGRVVRQFKFRDLEPNRIGLRLRQLDDRLNDNQGLRRISDRTRHVLRSDATVPPAGRILLFVHGTFSSVESMVAEIEATPEGRAFLKEALDGPRYQEVLAFNHGTLATTPVLNAVRLAEALRGSMATVDIVCHSRGGLVARWFREWLDDRGVPPGRTIYVGSPLGGTSLAAPARLKHALDLLTNFARAMEQTAQLTGAILPAAAPFATAAAVLFGLIGKVASVGAKLPILDAGVSMIPGLAAQSREGANDEVLALRGGVASASLGEPRAAVVDHAYAIRTNFESPEIGWRFWRIFRGPLARVLDRTTDAVFPGDNDLVVDTAAMLEFADGVGIDATDAERCLTFASGTSVHHCNYFQQPETIRFIRRVLLEGPG